MHEGARLRGVGAWGTQGDTERNLLGRMSTGLDSTEQGLENESPQNIASQQEGAL